MPEQEQPLDLEKLERVVDAAIRLAAQPYPRAKFRDTFNPAMVKQLIKLLRVAHGDIDIALYERDNAERACDQHKERVTYLEKTQDAAIWAELRAHEAREEIRADLKSEAAKVEAWREAAELLNKKEQGISNPKSIEHDDDFWALVDRADAATKKARALDSTTEAVHEPAGGLWDQPANASHPSVDWLRNVTSEEIQEAAQSIDMEALEAEIKKRIAPYCRKNHADMTKVYGSESD